MSVSFCEALISFCEVNSQTTIKDIHIRCKKLSALTKSDHGEEQKKQEHLSNKYDWCKSAKLIVERCWHQLNSNGRIGVIRNNQNAHRTDIEVAILDFVLCLAGCYTNSEEGCMKKCIASGLMYTIIKYIYCLVKDIKEPEDNQSTQWLLRDGVMTIVYNCSRTPYNRDWYRDPSSLEGISSSDLRSRYISKDNKILEDHQDREITSVQSMVSNIQEISHAITSKWKYMMAATYIAPVYHLSAVLTLAHLYCEADKTNVSLVEEEIVSRLMEYTIESLHSKNFECESFSLEEMLNGLQRMVVNTENQQKIVDAGVLDVVLKVLQHDHIPIAALNEALKVVWQLSFSYCEKIKENTTLCQLIYKLKDNEHGDVSSNASGIEWELNKNQIDHDDTEHSAKHIMISYSWKQKSVVKDIVVKLKEYGFKLWFDESDMTDELCIAMAHAIQNAEVFLLFASRTYQESANCKSEATYARERNVKIIPIILEEDWKPDNWLGFIMSDKYYIKIPRNNPSMLLNTFDELRKKLESHITKPDSKHTVNQVDEHRQNESGIVKEIKMLSPEDWDQSRTLQWMDENDIIILARKHNLNGEKLKFLYELMSQHPVLFYKFLMEDFSLGNFDEVSNFVIALQKLFKNHLQN
ncbi:uncharacterized protein LOC130612138 isoform X2 [Hydractinia symbiolongicarpus]|uniref:uncharacterized protein LOC130612138 isoform X2 n=1 Tax=Hydractinia symbiolongicarpus TaxID=13093 RepID=UPI00254EA47C|nr:uncharacterized protein LOC130612138 isoform X2 [Hydractinia symbiolongicarpus]